MNERDERDARGYTQKEGFSMQGVWNAIWWLVCVTDAGD